MLNDDIFDALVDEIERDGGELFPEAHVGMPLIYEVDGQHGRKVKRNAETAGCGASALVRIPYTPAFLKVNGLMVDNINGEQQFSTNCIICDRVYLWPRFAHLQPRPR